QAKGRRTNVRLAALAWPFKDSKAKKLLGELKQCKDAISLALTTESVRDTKAIFAALTEMQRQEIYNWLHATDPSTLHHQACDRYESGTGDCVLRLDQWKAWLEGSSRSIWIRGIPGASKTILVSHLATALKACCGGTDNISLHYYCFYNHFQDEAMPFLKWILNQLCRRAGEIPTYLYELYSQGSEPSLGDLLKAVEETVKEYDRIFVVVDAVDESMPRENILKVIRDFATDERFQNVHILVTSRDYIDVEDVMFGISTTLWMSDPLLDDDIKLFVRSKLDTHPRIKNWPPNLKEDVFLALSAKAKGM
ncbi:hypothetical protein B0T24DRAFT_526281, partial [Lasiosphaeria ovina]